MPLSLIELPVWRIELVLTCSWGFFCSPPDIENLRKLCGPTDGERFPLRTDKASLQQKRIQGKAIFLLAAMRLLSHGPGPSGRWQSRWAVCLFWVLLVFSFLSCNGLEGGSKRYSKKARQLQGADYPAIYNYEIVTTYPHDPKAFTQVGNELLLYKYSAHFCSCFTCQSRKDPFHQNGSARDVASLEFPF